jgi:SAM-dependent methyltransferase
MGGVGWDTVPGASVALEPKPGLTGAFHPSRAPNRRCKVLVVVGCEALDMTNRFDEPGFFDRADPSPDATFYSWPRLVTHIDDEAIAAVERLYEELAIDGDVLDLMASWISHFRRRPRHLTVLGMNATELEANPQATDAVVHDLNADPRLPLPAGSFDAVVCCVSVDYLVHPVEVFTDVARVLRPAGVFVCTFSNRCFPMKAVRGWLATSDAEHCSIVAGYFERSRHWSPAVVERRTPLAHLGDPLFAVWATRADEVELVQD